MPDYQTIQTSNLESGTLESVLEVGVFVIQEISFIETVKGIESIRSYQKKSSGNPINIDEFIDFGLIVPKVIQPVKLSRVTDS